MAKSVAAYEHKEYIFAIFIINPAELSCMLFPSDKSLLNIRGKISNFYFWKFFFY